jgi:ADP-heptose:LPS heptosyltransferase
VEVVLRGWLGWLLALLLVRPGRGRLLPLLQSSRRVLLVRIDNRVGEALLMTPLVEALRATHEVELLVHPKCARVLQGLPGVKAIHVFERRWLRFGPFGPEVRQLRALTRGAIVVNCAAWTEYSGTVALLSRLISPHAVVVGPGLGAARWLADVIVRPRTDTTSEVQQRLHYLSPFLAAPHGRMAFRAPVATPALTAFREGIAGELLVVNPGGRLGERRVPPGVFSAAARAALAKGLTPVVTWGPGEEALANQVVAGAPGSVLAPPTDLDGLAWLMSQARRVVCNNTGPMHLAVAVGAPTLALFYRMPVARWGHAGGAHVMLDLTDLDDAVAMGARVETTLNGLLRA